MRWSQTVSLQGDRVQLGDRYVHLCGHSHVRAWFDERQKMAEARRMRSPQGNPQRAVKSPLHDSGVEVEASVADGML